MVDKKLLYCILLQIPLTDMSRRKSSQKKQFDNVDYVRLTENDNGFVDSQVGAAYGNINISITQSFKLSDYKTALDSFRIFFL